MTAEHAFRVGAKRRWIVLGEVSHARGTMVATRKCRMASTRTSSISAEDLAQVQLLRRLRRWWRRWRRRSKDEVQTGGDNERASDNEGNRNWR